MSHSKIEVRLGRIKRILATPRLPVWLAIFAALLAAPSLDSGWYLDDLWHRQGYVGYSGQAEEFAKTWNLTDEDRLAGPMRMYSFLSGDPERVKRVKDIGVIPWWADEQLRLNFWRPLSALTHVFDYALWPDRPMLMHLQSLFWLALLALTATLLYRRIVGPAWVAGLAALLFVVDDTHATTAGWLANRHGLLSALFGVSTLLAHDRWVRRGQSRWPVVPCLLLALALASAEAGIAAFAYLIAYALFIDERGLRHKLAALLPYVFCIGVWRIIYTALGYGASGSEAYVDPGRDPFQFIATAFWRGPILLTGALAWPPADIYFLLPIDGIPYLYGYSLIVAVGLFWLFRPLLRDSDRARFWACGMILSIVPLCAALPSNRNLSFTCIGASGLVAEWIHWEFSVRERRARRDLRRIVAVTAVSLFLLIHLVGGVFSHFVQPGVMKHFEDEVERFADIEAPDSEIVGRDLVVANGAGVFPVGNLIPYRIHSGRPLPAHIRALAYQLGPIEIFREDDRTLLVRPDSGFYHPPQISEIEARAVGPRIPILLALEHLNGLHRDTSKPMKMGERIDLTGLQIEITALSDRGRPTEARFRFDAPLEDPSLLWLRWSDGKYREFSPPSVGETAIITPLSGERVSNAKGEL